MKQFIDFIPLIIFFAFYKMYGIIVATGALIIATAVQIALTYFIYKKVEKIQLVTFIIVAFFGTLTILLDDPNFIKWKVTIVYMLFALGLFVTNMIGKPVIKGMLGKEITLSDTAWANINRAWIAFFTLCAISNIYVAFYLSESVWVNFKVFGLLIATFGFTLLTGIYIYKQLPKEEKEPDSEKEL